MSEIIVNNNRDASRFEIQQDGETAVLEYDLVGQKIVFTHTGVPAALEGRGMGSALAKAGLQYARENSLKIVPLCPFVKGYLQRHPEYNDLITT